VLPFVCLLKNIIKVLVTQMSLSFADDLWHVLQVTYIFFVEPERSWPYSDFNLSQPNTGRTFIDVIISILLFQKTFSCSHYIADCVLPNFSYLNI
jgi:hypothetical protein